MGATYTRQSTFADGDTINAADSNDEFDQLLAAFAASTGHTHDGTAGEGGPISALASNSITFGTGADTDVAVTFDGNTSDGVLTWMEDEDYFQFSDDILMSTTEKLQFRDTAIYINSSADGQLDLVADTEIQIAATTIDINGNVDISGTLTIGSAGISEAELEILDGATLTTTELNIMDGDTSASATTVVDADRVVFNDDGTMKQVAVTDLAAYFDDEITAMPNLVTTAATTVGALNSGSITSGFGTIDNGASTITTTGVITGGTIEATTDTAAGDNAAMGYTAAEGLILTGQGSTNDVTIKNDADADVIEIPTGTTNVTVAGTLGVAGGSSNGVALSQGAIAIKNGGAKSYVDFYCESSNAHYTRLEAAAHSAYSGNVTATLPVTTGTLALTSEIPTTEAIQDIIGAMVSSNTETNITVTYEDGDGTLDFVVDAAQPNVTSLGTLTSLTVDDVVINGSNIGRTDDTDLMTVASGVLTVAGEVDAVSLDISGDADIDGTLEADAITIGGTAIASIFSPVAGSGSIVTTGALDAGSITSGFGAINNGASAITTTGVITGGTLEATTDTAAGDNAAIGYTAAEGLILTGQGSTSDITLKNDADATVFTVPTGTDDILFPDNAKAMFGAGSDLQIYHDGSNSYVRDSGTGNLRLTSVNSIVLAKHNNENMLTAATDGAVTLFYDSAEKLATTAAGVDVTGTIGVTGVVTANAGVVVDTMTLDGAALTATGDFTATVAGTVLVDAAGDIVLDAAGDDILLKSAGTHEGNINLASSNLTIKSIVSDKDIIFQGNDGGAGITALTLDMSAAGAATFNNDVTAFSDKRLKTDVTDIENALDKVQQMQGVYYRRNDVEDAKMQVGVLAQDMEQVLPEVVLTADDEMQTKSVDYGKITSVLIEAVKELSAKVEYLEGKKECSCGGDK